MVYHSRRKTHLTKRKCDLSTYVTNPMITSIGIYLFHSLLLITKVSFFSDLPRWNDSFRWAFRAKLCASANLEHWALSVQNCHVLPFLVSNRSWPLVLFQCSRLHSPLLKSFCCFLPKLYGRFECAECFLHTRQSKPRCQEQHTGIWVLLSLVGTRGHLAATSTQGEV